MKVDGRFKVPHSREVLQVDRHAMPITGSFLVYMCAAVQTLLGAETEGTFDSSLYKHAILSEATHGCGEVGPHTQIETHSPVFGLIRIQGST